MINNWWHKIMMDNWWHKIMIDNWWHETMIDNWWHKIMIDNWWHKIMAHMWKPPRRPPYVNFGPPQARNGRRNVKLNLCSINELWMVWAAPCLFHLTWGSKAGGTPCWRPNKTASITSYCVRQDIVLRVLHHIVFARILYCEYYIILCKTGYCTASTTSYCVRQDIVLRVLHHIVYARILYCEYYIILCKTGYCTASITSYCVRQDIVLRALHDIVYARILYCEYYTILCTPGYCTASTTPYCVRQDVVLRVLHNILFARVLYGGCFILQIRNISTITLNLWLNFIFNWSTHTCMYGCPCVHGDLSLLVWWRKWWHH